MVLALFTHLLTGDGGQFESLYHAVPMIGFPMFSDQFYNAKRMEYKVCRQENIGSTFVLLYIHLLF